MNSMKALLYACLTCSLLMAGGANAADKPCLASWYGEDHRGKLMANGKRFDPDKLTAASWFYPLGTKVRVTLVDQTAPARPSPSVVVTITDRGPAQRLVRKQGRKIDLAEAAFQQLAHPALGLVRVVIQPEVFPKL